MRNGFYYSDNRVEAEHDCLLEKWNLYKIGNEKLKILILEKNVAMKVMSTN